LAQKVGDDAAAAACVEKFRDAPFAFLRAIAARDAPHRHLKSQSLVGIVGLATTTALEMERSIQRKDTATQEPDPPGLTAQLTEASVGAYVRPAIWSAIIRAKVLGLSMTDLVANWREEIDPAQPYLADEANLCERYGQMTVTELSTILRDTRESSGSRMLAAVLLVGCDDTSLQDAVYAQVAVMDAAKDYELLRDVAEESIDALVRRDWRRFCENRFMLRSPELHVRGLVQACDSRIVGWSTAARIILAGLPTTNVNVPESMRRRLEEVAGRAV
jgi:hypothetical protein